MHDDQQPPYQQPYGQPPYQAYQQPYQQPYQQSGAVSDDDRTWGAIAHAGSFVAAWIALGVLAPVLVLALKGSRSAYVKHHAYESLNFQLNALLWIAASAVLAFVLIGIPMMVAVGIWYLVMVIIAAMAANRGEWFRYPLIIRFFRP